MTKKEMKQEVPTSRTCTTQRNVSGDLSRINLQILNMHEAKKEEHPEQALKEFRAIVDQEQEKGDWYAHEIHANIGDRHNSFLLAGGSKH